jgi:hypothetical protein
MFPPFSSLPILIRNGKYWQSKKAAIKPLLPAHLKPNSYALISDNISTGGPFL